MVLLAGPPPSVSTTAKLVKHSMKTRPAPPGGARPTTRPLNRRQPRPRVHAELGGQAPSLAGDRPPYRQEQPHRQRQVEEGVRDPGAGAAGEGMQRGPA